MKILLTGVTGQVGRALIGPLSQLGELICADRSLLDLNSNESIRAAMSRIQPTLVVNPAAYTAVDRAESQPEQAMQINGIAPGVLAHECARLGARLVHFSTDYVFDGEKKSAYLESDPTGPVGCYGRSKLAGEQAIAAAGCRHLIFRTSWVYDLQGANFLRTMFRLAGERNQLRVVADQHGAPTSAAAIAAACTQVLSVWLGDAQPSRDGIYHMSCAGSTSWHGFASAIMDRLEKIAAALALPCPASRPEVVPISTQDYPTAARRPHNSVLDNSRLDSAFNTRLPDWEQALDQLLEGRAARRTDPAN